MDSPLLVAQKLSSSTHYHGNESIYHVYPRDCTPYEARFRLASPILPTAFLLRDLQDVTLDFGGGTLLLHGKTQPFVIENCLNIVIKNVVVCHDRPSFTELEVIEKGDDFIRVKPNHHHPCRVEDGKLIPTSEYWENTNLDRTNMFIQSFDSDTRDGLGSPLCMIGKTIHRDPKFPFNVNQYVAYQDGDAIILKGPVFDCYKVGCILALGHESRDFSSVLVKESENITLDHYRVLNGAGMGILPIHSKDLTLNHVDFKYDNASQGIISNHADAIHAFACSGRLDIIDCTCEGMIDDALNIHSQFYLLESFQGKTVRLETRSPGVPTYCTIFGIGDTIGIHDGNTMDIEREYTIVDKRIIDNHFMELDLDAPIADHAIGSLVENLTAQPDITIRRSTFDKANSHLRFQSSGKILIEDCRIGLPILLTGDASYWYESSGIKDMTIANTTFASNKARIRITPEIMPSDREPYYHKNIRIKNCTFESCNPIEGSYADNIVLENTKQAQGKTMTLKLTNCGKVQADGCIIERHVETKQSLRVN